MRVRGKSTKPQAAWVACVAPDRRYYEASIEGFRLVAQSMALAKRGGSHPYKSLIYVGNKLISSSPASSAISAKKACEAFVSNLTPDGRVVLLGGQV